MSNDAVTVVTVIMAATVILFIAEMVFIVKVIELMGDKKDDDSLADTPAYEYEIEKEVDDL